MSARSFQRVVGGGRRLGLLPRPPESSGRSVVVIRTDEIGDMAMTVPYLRALRQAWPRVRISLIARPGPAALIRGSTLVDEVLDWEPLPGRQDTVLGQIRSLNYAREVLRRVDPPGGLFDLALLPRWDFEDRGARQIAAAVAVRSVGFDTTDRPASRRDNAEARLLTHPVCSGDATAHELQHTRRLAAAVGVSIDEHAYHRPGLSLIDGAEQDWAQGVLDRLPSIEGGRDLVLALGAGAAKRRWSPEHYAAVVAAVHRRTPVRVILVGGPDDTAAAQRFRTAGLDAPGQQAPMTDLTGRTSLRQTLAVCAAATAYLGGDTGTMHLASSVGVPCLVVSCHPDDGDPRSANAPNRFGPWSPGSRQVRPQTALPGCHGQCWAEEPHCIETVTESEVTRQLLDVLAVDDLPEP